MTAAARSLMARIALLRQDRRARRRRTVALLVAPLIAGFALTLMLGQSLVPPLDVLRVLAGLDVPGATFAILDLRLPRATLSILAGLSFGLAGAACQTMLRNPLANPGIIGITAGASVAAIFAIVVLSSCRGPSVSILAVAAGLATAFTISLLSWRGGVAGTRLIFVGIGIAALIESAVAHILSRAPGWSLQDAMRWLTGSRQCLPVLMALVVFGGAAGRPRGRARGDASGR